MRSDVQSDSNLETVLQKVFYYNNHAGITVRDVASLTEKHPRQVYHYISGERKPDLAFIRTLSVYMIQTHGDDRIVSYFLPNGWHVVREAESDRTNVARVLHVLEQAMENILQILLMDDARAAEIEADALVRFLGEIRRHTQTDHASQQTGR